MNLVYGVEKVHSSFDMLQLISASVTLPSYIDIHAVSGYAVGTQYLQNLSKSSAEMTQYLCNIKMSATTCITKNTECRSSTMSYATK